jgi:hypothetical protein
VWFKRFAARQFYVLSVKPATAAKPPMSFRRLAIGHSGHEMKPLQRREASAIQSASSAVIAQRKAGRLTGKWMTIWLRGVECLVSTPDGHRKANDVPFQQNEAIAGGSAQESSRDFAGKGKALEVKIFGGST